MKRSKLSEEKQFKLIEHFAAGTAARTASVLVKVNKTTASYYFLRLRELIFEYEKEEEVFNGEIEVDGTARVYFVKLFWRQKKRKKRKRSLHIKYQCLVY